MYALRQDSVSWVNEKPSTQAVRLAMRIVCVHGLTHGDTIMNMNLYNRVKAALNTDRPKVQGYKGLSHSDIETVLMCVDAGIPLNYATAEARRLYQDLVG